jgi:hypothetical protein
VASPSMRTIPCTLPRSGVPGGSDTGAGVRRTPLP